MILLETALIKAHGELLNQGHHINLTSFLLSYEAIYRETYLHVEQLAKIVTLAGESLRKQAHVYYLAWGSPTLVAVLDASECVPTFSASFDDVKAFGQGSPQLQCKTGQTSVDGSDVDMSLEYFTARILPSLSKRDTVVFICLSSNYVDEATKIVKQVSEKEAKTVGILSHSEPSQAREVFDVCIQINKEKYNTRLTLDTTLHDVLCQCLDEFAVKLALNATSTGGHVIKGKVMRSLMIDVKISNEKLFRRAVGIISEFARVDENEALTALLKAIYGKDEVTESCRNDVITNHVTAGNAQDQVVPLAILLAGGKCTVESGRQMLDKYALKDLFLEYL